MSSFFFFAFVGLGESNTLGSSAASGPGSVAVSGASSGAEILFGLFIGDILLLKILIFFSYALRNNPAFFISTDVFPSSFVSLTN